MNGTRQTGVNRPAVPLIPPLARRELGIRGANGTCLFPKTSESGRPAPLIIVCSPGTVVDTFDYRLQVLALKDDCSVSDRVTAVRWGFPAEQFQVWPVHEEPHNSFPALLVRTGAVAELLSHNLHASRVHAPLTDAEPWVVLKAATGYCWVNGNFQPYVPDHHLHVLRTVMSRIPRLRLQMPWNAHSFATQAQIMACEEDDVVKIRATAAGGINARVFVTTAADDGLKRGGRWTCIYPATQVLRARHRAAQSPFPFLRTLCIPVGAAAKLRQYDMEPIEFEREPQMWLLTLPAKHEWICE